MSNLTGVYLTQKKDKTPYYRASTTYRGKHISLGSFSTELEAHNAYKLSVSLLMQDNSPLSSCVIEDYFIYGTAISFSKWVMLINLRDNNVYCRNPIYLKYHYFLYYLDIHTPLKFDTDDLFYYTNHKIMRRGGHLFVSDYGMQVNILSRYGIKNYAVLNRDYRFSNGDLFDYRYGNIEIINRFYGVTHTLKHGKSIFTAKIHVNGNIIIGRYLNDIEADIAYNKAADLLNKQGVYKNFFKNYIEELDEIHYAKLYNKVRISSKIRNFK